MTLRYAHLAPHNLVDAVKTLDPAKQVDVVPTPVIMSKRRRQAR
jgi:hypothetical protein